MNERILDWSNDAMTDRYLDQRGLPEDEPEPYDPTDDQVDEKLMEKYG